MTWKFVMRNPSSLMKNPERARGRAHLHDGFAELVTSSRTLRSGRNFAA